MIVYYIITICLIWNSSCNGDPHNECYIDGKTFPEGFKLRIESYNIDSCICIRNNTLLCNLEDFGDYDHEQCVVKHRNYPVGSSICTKNALSKCLCIANNLMECHLFFQPNETAVQSRRLKHEGDVCVINHKPFPVGTTITINRLNIEICKCISANTINCYLGDSKTGPNEPGKCIVGEKVYNVGTDIDEDVFEFLICMCLANNVMQCYQYDKPSATVVQSRLMQNEKEVCVIVNKEFAVGFTFPVNLLSINTCKCIRNNTIDCYLADSNTDPNDPGRCIVYKKEYKLGTDIDTKNKVFLRCICLANNVMQCYLSANPIPLSESQSNLQADATAVQSRRMQNEEVCVLVTKSFPAGFTFPVNLLGILSCKCIRNYTIDCYLNDSNTDPHEPGRCIVKNKEYKLGTEIDTKKNVFVRCICLANNVMQCYLSATPITLSESQSNLQGRNLANSRSSDEGCHINNKYYTLEQTIPFDTDVVCGCLCIRHNLMKCATQYIPDIVVGQKICLINGTRYNIGDKLPGWQEDIEVCECTANRVITCFLNYLPTMGK